MAEPAESVRALVQGRGDLRAPRALFRDSDGDGIGDFRGLIEKLDYLQELGVTAMWLLPFYPSPLRDDGYDIADYRQVHPGYGTLRDFRAFLREAHRRGLRVITELVLNHTSDEHPWFQRARRARPGILAPGLLRLERHARALPGSAGHLQGLRDLQLDLGLRSPGPTTGTASTPTSPNLNYDNPRSAQAMFEVVDFWLEMGVDGLRLDAVPYLFEREGTTCENLPETHEFLPASCAPTSTSDSTTGCCWPRRTSGPRTPSPTSATATSATWRSTSR